MGYKGYVEIDGQHADMLMDLGVMKVAKGEHVSINEAGKEVAILILSGACQISCYTADNAACAYKMSRESLFDEKPQVLHVCVNTAIEIEAEVETELLILKAENDASFDHVFYDRADIKEYILGENVMEDTSKRVIRDIFNYENAPYSKLVVGEIINMQGRWSSYPPHQHPQPEVYYYRFDKPQGFGCSVIGNDVYKITHDSVSCIPGGLNHPQVSAPGYRMYYCWVIRHLDGNPWEMTRIFDPEHKWVLD